MEKRFIIPIILAVILLIILISFYIYDYQEDTILIENISNDITNNISDEVISNERQENDTSNIEPLEESVCGDNVCNYEENENTCPIDCELMNTDSPNPTNVNEVCGDEICGTIESNTGSCPKDCQ